jgi:serine/threonine-protein kinase RsbT
MITAHTETRDRLWIRHPSDVVVARRRARELATAQGLSSSAVEALATAVTEIATNIVVHSGTGVLVFSAVEAGARRGAMLNARDFGPGISNVDEAMRDGFSTAGGLGFGLAGAKRMVDEFEIESQLGIGTTVTLCKWA